MLKLLKRGKYNTNEILCFKRNEDAGLEELYDGLVETLKGQKFIYDQHSRKYYKTSEVIVADGFDKGLFLMIGLMVNQLSILGRPLLLNG